jgi:hypothetical protein
LAATGRRFPPEDCRVLDDIAAVMTLADPRIYPLKVTRLASSYGNAISGVAAGTLCMNSRFVGPAEVPPAAGRVFQEIDRAVGNALDQDDRARDILRREIGRRKFLPGFGVIRREKDERLPALRDCLARRGRRHERRYWRLYELLVDVVRTERDLEPNISSGIAAAALDLGILPDQLGIICALIGIYLTLPNAFEGARQQPAVLQALPVDCIDYQGPPERTSPRAWNLGKDESS